MISWTLIGWRSVGAAALLTLAACGQPVATPAGEDSSVSDDSGERGEGGENRSDDGGEGGESGESGESGEGGN